MCVIETKTYDHADGRREIIETRRRCRNARGTEVCTNITRRNVEQASIVEHRPATTGRSDPNAVLVTQSRGGRETVYQDVSKRTIRRTSTLRNSTVTGSRQSPVDSPSSASSSSFVEMGPPPAPSPPLSRASFPLPGITPQLKSSDEPATRRVAPDGTAIYERPPSLEQPRAMENERRPRFVDARPARSPSLSSTAAELGDSDPTPRQPRRRRQSIIVDTSARPSLSSSPTTSSPGLSQLPRLSASRRHDSATDLPAQQSRRESNSEGRHRKRLQRDEDERQAQLERARLAESERRQEARLNAALNSASADQDASVERHRRKAAAALEGGREHRREQRERQADLEAELAQVRRERDAANARKRESDQVTRDNEPTPNSRSSRRTTGGSFAPHASSPLSARPPTYPVTVHHEYPPPLSARRRDSSLYERGEAVIAREQIRGDLEGGGLRSRTQQGPRHLSSMLDDVSIDDPSYDDAIEYELDDYYTNDDPTAWDWRRRGPFAEREERRRNFFD